MLFGTGSAKFTYSGSTITLENSTMRPDWYMPNINSTVSIHDHYTTINFPGAYSEFTVDVNLHQYANPTAKFDELYPYLYRYVHFFPHSDGNAISSSNHSASVFFIDSMKHSYVNNDDVRYDMLSIHFKSIKYTEIPSASTWYSSGGEPFTSGTYRIHEFYGTGSSLSIQYNNTEVTYLIVGPGGNNPDMEPTTDWVAGGAGGGAVIFIETSSLNAGVYPVVVGTCGDTPLQRYGNGLDSSFNGLTALRGGDGNSEVGGCGGGGVGALTAPTGPGAVGGANSGSYGYSGGRGYDGTTKRAGGGGGGAGGAGGNAGDSTKGASGIGRTIFISGSAKLYSPGGQGAGHSSDGATTDAVGAGAGGSYNGDELPLGRSGIVIIKVKQQEIV